MSRQRSSGTKARILFLQQYFHDHTDDAHPVTGDALIDICEANGLEVNRNTLRDDIAALNAAGTEILVGREGGRNQYRMGTRLFEPAELRMLVDAVSSCRAITGERSAELIHKLTRLASAWARPSLTARVYTADRVHAEHAGTLRSTDTLCAAISEGRQVTFRYIDYVPGQGRVLRHDGEEYTLSPWALIWNDDRYYAVGHTAKRSGVTTFRVDRMLEPVMTDVPAVLDPTFNPSEYVNRVFRLYADGQPETPVTLLCDDELMKNLVDRFGESLPVKARDDGRFLTRVTVVPSATFFSWVFQYGGRVRIVAPASVRAAYERQLRAAMAGQDMQN